MNNDVPLNLVAHPCQFTSHRHMRVVKKDDVILSASHLGVKNPCIYAGGLEGPERRWAAVEKNLSGEGNTGILRWRSS
jgi:hypothetical protein